MFEETSMRAAFVDANASLAEVMRRLHRPGDLPVTIHEDPDITPEDLPRLLRACPSRSTTTRISPSRS